MRKLGAFLLLVAGWIGLVVFEMREPKINWNEILVPLPPPTYVNPAAPPSYDCGIKCWGSQETYNPWAPERMKRS